MLLKSTENIDCACAKTQTVLFIALNYPSIVNDWWLCSNLEHVKNPRPRCTAQTSQIVENS